MNSIKLNAVVLLALMPGTRQFFVPKAVAGDLLEVEAFERNVERRALLDNRVSAQAALLYLVHQILKELAVVPARSPPPWYARSRSFSSKYEQRIFFFMVL